MWDGLSTTLAGERIVLEPLAERHAQELRQLAQDARIFVWMSRRLNEPGQFDIWLQETLAAAAAGCAAPFATVARVDGRVLGSTRFMTLRPADRGLEIGWTWLTPSLWGSGVNVEAKLLMLRHAFETLGCVRVELNTHASNGRSRRAMAALPAQFEGIHRRHRVQADGLLRDSAFYSVIDSEWPDVRANLERRLASSALSS
ncbi:MAG: GNAT family protein [Conexibacter sp.]